MKIATTEHKYYPTTWLSKSQAEAVLKQAGYPAIRVTAKWCKENGVNVATTGHVGAMSLQFAIGTMNADHAQRERDLKGL